MTEKRETTNFRIHDVRLIYTRDLWIAPDTFKGQKVPEENRRFKASVIIPKSAASQGYNGPGGRAWAWMAEPILQPLKDALGKTYVTYMNGQPLEYLKSPVKDGDVPNEKGQVPDYIRGHWTFIASCGLRYPPSIEGIVSGQAVPVPAQVMGGRKLWDDGDHASLDLSITKSGQKATEFVIYVNSVLFLRPGERINVGASRASGDEMMKEAAAKGYQVTGLNGGALPSVAPNGGHGMPFAPAAGPQGQPSQPFGGVAPPPSNGFVAPTTPAPFAGPSFNSPFGPGPSQPAPFDPNKAPF